MNLAAVATAAGVAYALGWLARQPEVAAARREASTDALTGLTNRHGLKHHLRIRAEQGKPYTIYMIDLNGFKAVNDAHGHRTGDHLLRVYARRLTGHLAPCLVARLGGDEFMVVEDGPRTGDGADRIARATERPFPLPGCEPVSLGAAVGLVLVPAGGDYRAAMHTADMAMYRSKRQGAPVCAGVLPARTVQASPQQRTRDRRPVCVAEDV